MVEFGGWDMPLQYEGIIAEHEHTRTVASIFDTCHMGEFELRGKTAESDLERLLTQNIPSLGIGQCRYGYMLNEEGGVLDDLTCYRLDDDRYWLIVNAGTLAKDRAWIQKHLSIGTLFTDRTEQIGKFDVQGPKSRELLELTFGIDVPELGFFRAVNIEIDGIDVFLSRTGYTGEWGYELYLPVEKTEVLWDRLLETGGIKPAGLGARDTLRFEMGYPLYGSDLSEERTPVACARGMFIGKKKDFIGRAAVDRDLNDGCTQYLTALRLSTRRAARPHDKVFFAGEEVGEVTSGSLAPSLGVAVALAYVDAPAIETGREFEIGTGRRDLTAKVVDLPFYQNGTVR